MATTYFKRALMGLVLGGCLLVAAPSIAAADTLIYQGYNSSTGRYMYYNVQTGASFGSAHHLGDVRETDCDQVGSD